MFDGPESSSRRYLGGGFVGAQVLDRQLAIHQRACPNYMAEGLLAREIESAVLIHCTKCVWWNLRKYSMIYPLNHMVEIHFFIVFKYISADRNMIQLILLL